MSKVCQVTGKRALRGNKVSHSNRKTIKFTEPKGKITLECQPAANSVQVHVRDTGRGIPEDKLLEIFEPFVQVARSAGAPGEGVGLGLAISRDLSRAMGGELTAQSEIGRGSIFTLTLPLA